MHSSEQKNIRVVVRVRPQNRRELEQNQRTIVKIVDTSTLLFDPDEDEDEFFYQGVKQNHRDITKRINKNDSMVFDRLFGADANNQEIFEECTKPLVMSVMNGYNCSVFVYGATGSGKTFTMLGNEGCAGLTFLTMRELFKRIDVLSETRKFDIGISYLEVYNEQVLNLLTKTGPLKLCEDSNGVVVNGLILRPIQSPEQLIDLLVLGNKNRTQHPTDANAESSRSHAIFQVHIRMTEKKTGQKRTVKLSMIDLAGSERAASTKGIGVRFKEGANINKSLLALGNCINKLADGSKHIPYRDSNLTRILKDSLGGNCQTVMIANVSPSSLTYEDTYNTLRYASRAKKIRTTVTQNIMKTNMPKDYYVRKVCDLQEENERLKNTVKQSEIKVRTESNHYDESTLSTWYQKIDDAYTPVIKAQDDYFSVLTKDKILKLRAKLKEYAEDGKKALCVDGLKLTEDIARMDASIDRFVKQKEKLKDDLMRWKKRYQDALKDLHRVKKEAEHSQSANILATYIKGKEYQLEALKANIKTNHIIKINSFYHDESKRLRKFMLLSSSVIQRNYFLLRANGLVDTELQDSINRLVQINSGQRDVKFFDKIFEDSDEKDHNLASLSFDAITLPTDDVEESNSMKRANSDDNVNIGSRSRKMLKVDDFNINELQLLNEIDHISGQNDEIVSNKDASDFNATFQVPVAKKDNNLGILKNILTEQNVNSANRVAISKALIKSNVAPQKIMKVALGVSKENNKKFSPNRVQKSPRPANRNVTSRALASAANFLNRQRTKTNDGDSNRIVRVNRAASMRMRKAQLE